MTQKTLVAMSHPLTDEQKKGLEGEYMLSSMYETQKMKNFIQTLRNRKTGYGHFNISIEVDGKELSTNTTNTMAIDAAFDECYDDEDNSGRYYESREEAQEALVNEILRANEIL